MMEKKARIAIAASLAWMAMATFLILGTHGPALAKGGAAVDTGREAPAAAWKALPAHGVDARMQPDAEVQC
jgi:hypothetical protein